MEVLVNNLKSLKVQSIGFSKNSMKNIADDYSKLNSKNTKSLGQYFTTNTEILKKLLDDYTELPEKILEPSCGVGNIIDIISNKNFITAYEVDEDAIKIAKSIFPSVNFINQDFLKCPDDKYDLIIGNPPYFEVKKSEVDSYYSDIMFGRMNIYYMFIYKCVNMLKMNGELRFVIPKAFLSNIYASKCRRYLTDKCEIIGIESFDDTNLFPGAIQSVIILKAKRTESVTKKNVLHVGNNIFITKEVPVLSGITIESLGCKVKTGSIVWNTNKNLLTDSIDNSIRLLYSSDVTSSSVTNKLKKKYMKVTEDNRKHIVSGDILITQRISKRMFCSLVSGNFFIENHVNFITGPIEKLLVIKKSLNDPRTTMFIKQVIGSTQVSQSELETVIQIYN